MSKQFPRHDDAGFARLDDAKLVALAQEGSAPAFGAIYDRHVSGVARALASFAGPDRDLLDDLIQDVFLRVVERLESYTPTHPFPHWLYTIALNVGRNHARRQSKIVPVNPSDLHGIRDTSEPPVDGSEAIAAATLMRLVARLSLPMREVVSLRIGSEMSYHEIAEMLGIPEGTARRRMHDAMRILRDDSRATDARRSSENA